MPNRMNFIFNLNIGNTTKTNVYEDNRFQNLYIDFNSNFQIFYSQKIEKSDKSQPDYTKNLSKDALAYLEEKRMKCSI